MKSTLTFILSITTWCLYSQGFDKAKMDSLFARIEKSQRGMGSISIFNDEKEVYQKTIGFADVEKNVKAFSKTKYRIGSISKTFTAAMIMQLIDENRLSLQTKLADFFPELPNADEITIEQLLRHRSGLYNFTGKEDYTEWMEYPVSKSELLQKFKRNGTTFNPGEKFEYSNTNYVLLSYIIEEVDGESFADVLKKRITLPLQLENTKYGGEIQTKDNEALSYHWDDGWKPATKTNMSIPAGAGAIISTPTDLNVFYHALFNGDVVSDNSLSEMKKIADGFGLGLILIPFYEKMAYGHNGGIDGFQSSVAYFPDEQVTIAYTANGVAVPVNNILIGALSIFFEKDYPLPEFQSAIFVKSEDLDQYLGVYSSPSFPLKITITKEDGALRGQATGQASFPLEAYDRHKFRFEPAMLQIHFFPVRGKLLLHQSGSEFELTKE